MILFLNKKDLFLEKIKEKPLTEVFPDYKGQPPPPSPPPPSSTLSLLPPFLTSVYPSLSLSTALSFLSYLPLFCLLPSLSSLCHFSSSLTSLSPSTLPPSPSHLLSYSPPPPPTLTLISLSSTSSFPLSCPSVTFPLPPSPLSLSPSLPHRQKHIPGWYQLPEREIRQSQPESQQEDSLHACNLRNRHEQYSVCF